MRPSHYRTRPKVDLTPRQRQVLELVASGKTNPEIAEALGITLDGAKFHVSEILDRLGVSTREEAAAWWREQHGVRARLLGVLPLVFTRWIAIGGVGIAGAAIAGVVIVSLMGASRGMRAEDVPPPSATTPAVTPTMADGPVRIVSAVSPSGGTRTVYAIAKHGSVVSQFDLPPSTQVELAPGGLLLLSPESLSWTRVNGTDARVLYSSVADTADGVWSAEASPDGKTVAVGIGGAPGPNGGAVVFVDFATGHILRTVPVTPETWPGFVGFPWQLTWRSDGSGVGVVGGTQSERPGGAATVLFDGTVNVVTTTAFGALSPDGRLFAYNDPTDSSDIYGAGCLSVATHGITIRDMATGAVVASITDITHALTRYTWSPDGSAFLYSSQEYTPGECIPANSPATWYLLPRDDGAPALVADVDALFAEWYGQSFVPFSCDGVVHPPTATATGQPVGTCRDGSAASLVVDGKTIATAGQFVGLGVLP